MKQKHIHTPLVDEYLQSLDGLQPAETDPFFYTRLKALMEKQATGKGTVGFGYRLAAICMLCIFLSVNYWMLAHPRQQAGTQATATTAQQAFVNTYSVGGAPSY